MRLAFPFSLALACLIATDACAHVGYKIQMTSQFKETKKGSSTFRNIFVTGHAHYPDGTVLKVGVRSEKVGGSYILWANAVVRKEEFAAELGPWNQSFPPGKYIAEAWFEFDKQPEAVRSALKEQDEFRECLKDDPAYQERYKKENPERYEKLMKQIASSGKCASNKQFGACELMIGTPDDAAQETENEKAFIRDHVDATKELLGELIRTEAKHKDPNRNAAINQDAYAGWVGEWQDVVSKSDLEISERRKAVIVNEFSDVYACISNALISLFELEQNVQSFLYGDAVAKQKELDELLKKGDGASKDEKRHRDSLKREMAALVKARAEMEKRTVEALADAMHGKQGLDPSPELHESFIAEQKEKNGFSWED
ncbi:MAG: hypothetical protein HYY18_19925 [Planctomycetes bacterium]|nr:hypothetical protein [Planctomycetota bacterium]